MAGLAAPIFHHQYALGTCVMGRDRATCFTAVTSPMFTKDQCCPLPAHHLLRRCDLGHHICTGTAFTAGRTFLPQRYRGGSVPGVVQHTTAPAGVICSSSSNSQQGNNSTAWHMMHCPAWGINKGVGTGGWGSAGWQEKESQESRVLLSRWSQAHLGRQHLSAEGVFLWVRVLRKWHPGKHVTHIFLPLCWICSEAYGTSTNGSFK